MENVLINGSFASIMCENVDTMFKLNAIYRKTDTHTYTHVTQFSRSIEIVLNEPFKVVRHSALTYTKKHEIRNKRSVNYYFIILWSVAVATSTHNNKFNSSNPAIRSISKSGSNKTRYSI